METATKHIAVLPGDGIGPEVTSQALHVLAAVEDKFGYHFKLHRYAIGGEAIEINGTPLPEQTFQGCQDADAVLLGAVGNPKYDNPDDPKMRPEIGLLGLRKALDLYVNIRPVKVYPALTGLSPLREDIIRDTDLTMYRELSSGIYYGEKIEGTKETPAKDTCTYKYSEIERITKLGFEAAKTRRYSLTLIDKANVLATSRLWRKSVQEIAENYPDVQVQYLYVDNAAMQMALNPAQFDVVLTSNMFGDIISDLSSVIGGSLGLLPSASLGNSSAMFEPVHGSYPSAAGKDIANPVGAILSVKMMLEYFRMEEAAKVVESALEKCFSEGIGTEDLQPKHPYRCSQFGAIIASLILEDHEKIKIRFSEPGTSTII